MRIKIEGEYKFRIRTKVLWFWIVKPWETKSFKFEKQVPDQGFNLIPIPSLPGAVINVALQDTLVHVDLDFMDRHVFSKAIPIGQTRQLHAEPMKGSIIDATVTVS